MTSYEVGIQAFTHVTVDADSEGEAIERAREKADMGDGQINDSYATNLEE